MNISGWYSSMVTLPVIIGKTGTYRTRGKDTVSITGASNRQDFGCIGTYQDGRQDRWHNSGRLYFGCLSVNDIVERIGDC